LTEFQLEMEPKKIFSLLAIAAYYNGCFKECSRAFVKLESLPNLTDEEKERYQGVAVSIFIK
jgi:WD repeat-containing protein 35